MLKFSGSIVEIVERGDAFEIGFRDEDSISERKREHLLYDKHGDNLMIREYWGLPLFVEDLGRYGRIFL